MHILFVDSSVDNYQNLISAAKPGTKVVLLDSTRDGVEQITEELAQKQNIETVEIISHGGEGMVQLGSTVLSHENLSEYSAQLQQWRGALSENADILLFGCSVGFGQGDLFLKQLSQITGADVAASLDLTGNSALGGNWQLEIATGEIESKTAFSSEVQQTFTGILPVSVEYFKGTNTTEGNGTQRTEFKQWYGRRNLPDLRKDWSGDAPQINAVGKDEFALRWLGYVYADKTGEYKFYEKSDDGVRLWVNNRQIIDKWTLSGFSEENSGSIRLEAGKWYPIQMDYFEWDGAAAVELQWQPPGESRQDISNNKLIPLVSQDKTGAMDSGYGLKGEYFNNTNLSGTPVYTQIDTAINFDWGNGSPRPGKVNTDNFAVRWTGSIIIPEDGSYKFYTEIDDRVRLWIDNQLVINRWSPGVEVDSSDEFNFNKGRTVSIRLEYAEDGGGAKAKLSWEAKNSQGKIFDKAFIPATSLIPYAPSERPNITVRKVLAEEGKTAKFTIETSDTIPQGGVNVFYQLIPVNGASADDFSDPNLGQLVLTPLNPQKIIEINLIDDQIAELGEQLKLEILPGVQYQNTASDTVTIDDNEPFVSIESSQNPIEGEQHGQFKVTFDKKPPQEFKLYLDLPPVDQKETGKAVRGTIASTKEGSDYKLYYRYDKDNKKEQKDFSNDNRGNFIKVDPTRLQQDNNGKYYLTIVAEVVDDYVYEKQNNENITISLRDNVTTSSDSYGVDNSKKTVTLQIEDNEPTVSLGNVVHPSEGFDDGSTLVNLESALKLTVNNSVTIPANDSLNLNQTGQFTQEAWIFPTIDTNGEYGIIGSSSDAQSYPGIWLYNQTGIKAGFGDGENWNNITVENVINQNQWNHIATSFDGNEYRLYINGNLIYTTLDFAGAKPYQTQEFTIAGNDNGNKFRGQIDEVRLWNVARTYEQIQEKLIEPIQTNQEGLVGYWQFNNNTNDSSGNQNNGTLDNETSNDYIYNPLPQIGYVEVNLDKPVDNAIGLWVRYDLTGSATQGVDYFNSQVRRSTGEQPFDAIIIPNTKQAGRIYFTARPDAIQEADENIQISLVPYNFDGKNSDGSYGVVGNANNSNYGVDNSNQSATITIKDNNAYQPGVVIKDQFERVVNQANPVQAQAVTVQTNVPGTITVSDTGSPFREEKEKAFDNSSGTKWLIFDHQGWIQYQFNDNQPRLVDEYRLTSANDFPERDPQDWTLQGSNDGATWVIIDERKDQEFSDRFQTKSFKISSKQTTPFQYYRLNIADNSGGSELQLAEFQLLESGSNQALFDLTNLIGTVTASNNQSPLGEDKQKAFDDKISTKWLIFDDKGYLQYKFDRANGYIVTQYTITSANDEPNRDPKDWVLEASNNGENWVVLDRRDDETFTQRFQTKNFAVDNQTPYQYYRLNVQANQGAGELQLAELQLIGPNTNNAVKQSEKNFNVTFQLTSQPKQDVTVNLTNLGDLTASNPQFTIKPEDWDQPQLIGVDGITADGTIKARLTSSDPDYNTTVDIFFTAQDQLPTFTVTEGDPREQEIIPLVRITPVDQTINEGGKQHGQFLVELSDPAPEDGLTVVYSLGGSGDRGNDYELLNNGIIGQLKFAPGQTSSSISFNVLEDNIDETKENVSVTLSPRNNYILDSTYQSAVIDIEDNDVAGIDLVNVNTLVGEKVEQVFANTLTPLTTSEDGENAVFAVRLNTQPEENVTVFFDGIDATETQFSQTTLNFTANNWDQYQQVTVSGVEDDIQDGNISYQIAVKASSEDPFYRGISNSSVKLTNRDNDDGFIDLEVLNDPNLTEAERQEIIDEATQKLEEQTEVEILQELGREEDVNFTKVDSNDTQASIAISNSDEIEINNNSVTVKNIPVQLETGTAIVVDGTVAEVANNNLLQLKANTVFELNIRENNQNSSEEVQTKNQNFYLKVENSSSLQFIDGTPLNIANRETELLADNTLHKIASGTLLQQNGNLLEFKGNKFLQLKEGESVALENSALLEQPDGTFIEIRDNEFWQLGEQESVQLADGSLFKQNNGSFLIFKNNEFLQLESGKSVQLAEKTNLQIVYSTPLQLGDKRLQLANDDFLQLQNGSLLIQQGDNILLPIEEGTSVELEGSFLKSEDFTNPLELTINLDESATQDTIVRYGITGGSAIENVDYTITGGTFTLLRQIGDTNPFNGFDLGSDSSIDFADFDGDELVDALAVGANGNINYYQNNGTQFSSLFVLKDGGENPFNRVTIANSVSIADLNNDGLVDVVFGTNAGNIQYYQNTGSPETPRFTQQTNEKNPFSNINIGEISALALADIDGDDLTDLIVNTANTGISYYQNTGTPNNPSFTEQTGDANPLRNLNGSPAFADLDQDDDLDLTLGAADGTLKYYQNFNGTFVQQTDSNNPFGGSVFDVGNNSHPTFVDLDNNYHQDLVVGNADGTFASFINLPAVKIAQGQTSASLEITPIQDNIDENPETIEFQLYAGTNYQLDADTPSSFKALVTLTDDNDTAGVTITPLQTTTETSETGDYLNYELKLDTQPIAPVTVFVGANKPTEAQIASTSPQIKQNVQLADYLGLEFTPDNWNTPQTFTVVSVDDRIDDGGDDDKISYQLLTTVESQDPKYHQIKVSPVELKNIDDDLGGVNINLRGDAGKVEEGTTNVFTVTLKSQPLGEVNVTVIPGDDQIVLNGQKPRRELVLTFDEKNWDKEQIVRVVAVDDGLVEYDHQTQISFQVESEADEVYNNSKLVPEPLTLSIRDNDLPTARVVPGWTASELEGAPSGFMVYLSHVAPKREGDNGIKVNYEIIGGSATYDTDTTQADYQPIAKQGSVTVAPGDIQNNLLIVPIDDKLVENYSLKVEEIQANDEIVNLTLVPTKSLETITRDIETVVINDNFNNGINSEQLSTTAAIVDSRFSNTDGQSLFFTGDETRQAVTKTLDVSKGGTISFDLIFSNGSNGGDNAELGEDVVLEYSIDGGQSFTVLKTYETEEYTSWTTINESIPQQAQTQQTEFRWRQIRNSGRTFDNWGLDNINITGIKTESLEEPLQLVKGSKIKLDGGITAEVTENVAINSEGASVALRINPKYKDKIGQIEVGSTAEVAEETVQIRLLPGEGYELGSDKTEATLGIIDDDEPGVRIIEFGDHTTVVEGETATFQISLLSEPTSDVTIKINNTDNQVRALNSELTFTPQNWYRLQTVTIEGIDEAVAEPGDFHTTFLEYEVSSKDSTYKDFPVADQQINVIDRLIDKQEAIEGVTQGLRSTSEILNNLELPLLGSPEDKVPSITEGLDQEVAAAIDGTDNLTATKLESILEDALHNFEISLKDFGIDSVIKPFSAVDVEVEMSSDDLNVKFEVSDTYNLFDVALDADLGLPALGLETSGSISSFFSYTFGLGLGFHKDFGFYIDTENTKFEAEIAAILGEGSYEIDDDGKKYFQPNSSGEDDNENNKIINEYQSEGQFIFIKNNDRTYWDKNNNGIFDPDIDQDITEDDDILSLDTNGNGILDEDEEGSYDTDDDGNYYFEPNSNEDEDNKIYWNDQNNNGIIDSADFKSIKDSNGASYWDTNNNGKIDSEDKDITNFDTNGNGKLDDNLTAKANLWLLQFDVANDSENPSKLDIGFNVNLADDLAKKINFVDIDGDGNLDFTDTNNDGTWDQGEPFIEPTGKVKTVKINFTDSNNNGSWDAEESYTYVDKNQKNSTSQNQKTANVKKLIFNPKNSEHKQYESTLVETDSQGTKVFKGEVKTFEEEPVEVFLDVDFDGEHNANEPIGSGVNQDGNYILKYDSKNKKHQNADKNNNGKFDVEPAADDPGHGEYVQEGNIRYFDFNLNGDLDYFEPSTNVKELKEFTISKTLDAQYTDVTYYYFDSNNDDKTDDSDYWLIQQDEVGNKTTWYLDLNNDGEGQSYEKLDQTIVESISRIAQENEGEFTLKDYTTELEGTFVSEDDGDRLTASELVKVFKDPNLAFKDLISYNLGGEANLGLEMKGSIEGNAAIPSIGTNLAVNYPIFNYGNQEEAEEQKFTLAFNDLTLDLGSFITNFAKPVFDSINDLFEPIRPVIDVLNSDTGFLIKIFPEYDSNEKTGNNDGQLTLLEFFAGAANDQEIRPLLEPLLKKAGLTYERFQKSINTAKKLTDLFTKVDEVVKEIAAFEKGENITIDLGSYSFDDIKGASEDSDSSTAETADLGSSELAANTSAEDTKDKIAEQGQAADPGAKGSASFIDKVSSIEGLEFELFNPITILRILLGEKDVDLLTFDVPDLDLAVPFTTGEIPIPIPAPIKVTGQFDAQFGAKTDLFVGFDTHGLELWSESDFTAGDAYKVFDGFYLRDGIDENGDGILQRDEDSDEFGINALARLSLSASVVIAKLTGYGGLEGSAGLDIVDNGERNGTNDGKIRFSEVGEKLSQAFSGELGSDVGRIITEFINLTGKLEAFFGVEVKVGVDLGFFEVMKTVYQDELGRFTVFEFDLADLVGNPISQSNSSEVASAGELPLVEPTLGDDILDGTVDDDAINGGDGDDSIDGATGDDQLLGGKGNDTLVGDDGSDTLEGNFGDDSLAGNLGDDILEGGAGDDTIDGGAGGDRLLGDIGDDLLDGGKGADYIEAGKGDDEIFGGDGNDVLIGNAGEDTIIGGLGDDVLTGGADGDIFVFSSVQDSFDKIVDFNFQEDKIRIDLVAFGSSVEDAKNALSYNRLGILLYNDQELALIENNGLPIENFSVNEHIEFA